MLDNTDFLCNTLGQVRKELMYQYQKEPSRLFGYSRMVDLKDNHKSLSRHVDGS